MRFPTENIFSFRNVSCYLQEPFDSFLSGGKQANNTLNGLSLLYLPWKLHIYMWTDVVCWVLYSAVISVF